VIALVVNPALSVTDKTSQRKIFLTRLLKFKCCLKHTKGHIIRTHTKENTQCSVNADASPMLHRDKVYVYMNVSFTDYIYIYIDK